MAEITLDLNRLEKEIVRVLLDGPFRDFIIKNIKDRGYTESEDEISEAWGSAVEKIEEAF